MVKPVLSINEVSWSVEPKQVWVCRAKSELHESMDSLDYSESVVCVFTYWGLRETCEKLGTILDRYLWVQ